MKQNSQKNLVILISTLAIVVAGLIVFLLYKIYSYDAAYRATAVEIQEAAAKEAQLSSMRKLLREMKGEIDEAESLFLTEDGVPEFIESLESLGERAGVSVTLGSINLSEPTESMKIGSLQIRAAVVGSWSEVMSFLSRVENLPYALSVDSFSASTARGDAGSSGSWNTTLDIRALITP